MGVVSTAYPSPSTLLQNQPQHERRFNFPTELNPQHQRTLLTTGAFSRTANCCKRAASRLQGRGFRVSFTSERTEVLTKRSRNRTMTMQPTHRNNQPLGRATRTMIAAVAAVIFAVLASFAVAFARGHRNQCRQDINSRASEHRGCAGATGHRSVDRTATSATDDWNR